MKDTTRIISRYTADISGVCSALYELGGLTVMHDAGGYGSLYATHDEPRWYDSKSLIFVSGLTETQAILGDDQQLLKDTIQAAQRLKPKFISLTGSPIPMVIGTDFQALALEVQTATGIPTLGFDTDGMHDYITGISEALYSVATRFCTEAYPKNSQPTVNILGATPLDFSINGTVTSLQQTLTDQGFKVQATWAMTNSLADLQQSSRAHVNLVISVGGLKLARRFQAKFHQPYIVGIPYGDAQSSTIAKYLKAAMTTGQSQWVYNFKEDPDLMIVGEQVTATSLASAIFAATGQGSTIITPVTYDDQIPELPFQAIHDEDSLGAYLAPAQTIIADPLYRPICPPDANFIALPHEAFSGRIFHKAMPNLVTNFDTFLTQI